MPTIDHHHECRDCGNEIPCADRHETCRWPGGNDSCECAAPYGFAVHVTERFEYVDRGLATASWWDRYIIEPGVYPLLLVNNFHRPWNPNVIPVGMVRNPGPSYAVASVRARLVESYRENRLLQHVTADRRVLDEDATVGVQLYAYQVVEGGSVLGPFATIDRLPESCGVAVP